jgi:hypothetical protein
MEISVFRQRTRISIEIRTEIRSTETSHQLIDEDQRLTDQGEDLHLARSSISERLPFVDTGDEEKHLEEMNAIVMRRKRR